jgi:uncharacterized integral membrane protein (TIGR00697 family)
MFFKSSLPMQNLLDKNDSSQPIQVTRSIVMIAMLFVCLLIASNISSFKVIELQLTSHFSLEVPAAILFFPLTYLFDDVITEVYGFKMSRLIIWGGLFCSGLFTFCIWLAVTLPASPIWDANTHNGESAFQLVLSGSRQIFLASSVAYFFGEFLNAMVLAKLKVKTKGKYLFLRIISSTAVGAGIDTTIFCHIAFWNVLPAQIIWKLYLFKLTYEVVMLPVTYSITAFLKKIDNIDYYDTHTNFTPFSLQLSAEKA